MRPALTLVLLVALAGCGGDDRLSRAEFVERATAICTRAEERIQALHEPSSVAELETYAREARALAGAAVGELRELEPPAELEDAFERYLANGDAVGDLLEELESAAAAGDDAEARRIAGEIAAAANGEAARAAGLAACEDEGS